LEKRYQVFISSTFQDLQGARQEVSQALLRADCFPAGMELFPAADEEQFEFIKTVIDQSDYYILISAGRYGSIHPDTGLSYTEMEYDYAVETGKPVIRLLHKDPFNELKGEFIEQTDVGREKLEAFRTKLMKGKLVKFWTSPQDILIETVFALQDAQRRFPKDGWVRGDKVMNSQTLKELETLRGKVSNAEKESSNPSNILEKKIKAPVTIGLLKKLSGEIERNIELVDLLVALKNSSDDDDDLRKSDIASIAGKLKINSNVATIMLNACALDGLVSEGSTYFSSTSKFKDAFQAATVLKALNT